MTYSELMQNISLDKNLLICKEKHSPQHFGNFMIEFKYKQALLIQIINDRGVIEMSIIVSSFFSSVVVPLKYAVDFLQSNRNQQDRYTFQEIEEAYLFFHSSYKILDKIISENMLKSIANHWVNRKRN